MDENLIRVVKEEVHYWPECQCEVCTQERAKRSAPTPIKRISVTTAHLLGIISQRSPYGSLARQLANSYQLESSNTKPPRSGSGESG